MAAVERLAQAADMHIDGTFVDVDVAAPHAIEQLLTGEHPAGTLHQKFEQPEFRRTEIDRTARARHPFFLAIKLEIADRQHRRDPFRTGTAQQRTNARQEFRYREWFDDIVVGARRQTPHALAFLAAGRQHDDRQRLRLRPGSQAPAQFDAGETGQHPVEHDQIGRGFAQPRVSLVAAGYGIDFVTFRFEIIAQQRGQRLLVFHDQNIGAHCRSPCHFCSSAAPKFVGSPFGR